MATVSPKAILGANVEVGPYAYIDENVEIGDNCKIYPHATILPYVKIGNNCSVFPGAVVGAIPQDLKFKGEVTYVEIGDNVTIRECATINRGTAASGKGVTRVGNDTLIMSYVHVAHDCRVGNHCILVSYVGIAGETDVDDWAIIGGNINSQVEERANQLCDVFAIAHIRDKYPAEISGGEKQRTAVARALINRPLLILADEPTGNLDSKSSRAVIDSFLQAKQVMGATIFMVTHDSYAASFCDRAIILRDGQVWRSLERGNMDRTAFQDILLDSVREMGRE